MGGRERGVKRDTHRITLERYNSLCPPGKKDRMVVSRGRFSDMAIGAGVVMIVIARSSKIYGIIPNFSPPLFTVSISLKYPLCFFMLTLYRISFRVSNIQVTKNTVHVLICLHFSLIIIIESHFSYNATWFIFSEEVSDIYRDAVSSYALHVIVKNQ